MAPYITTKNEHVKIVGPCHAVAGGQRFFKENMELPTFLLRTTILFTSCWGGAMP